MQTATSAHVHVGQRRDAWPAQLDEHRLAILHPAVQSQPGVARLRWFERDRGPAAPVPDVYRLWHTETDDGRHEPGSVEERLIDLARRHAERSDGLRQLLGPETFARGARAFCELTGDAQQSGTVFSQWWLGGHEHYVHTRGLTKLRRSADEIRDVTIVTGLCLFSNGTVSVETTDGERLGIIDAQHARLYGAVREITADAQLTVYELESNTRLARFIADLVAALGSQSLVTVKIDIPRVQYYCYILDLLGVGLIDVDLLMRWFETVDRRCERVLALYRNTLRQWLAVAGVADRVVLAETHSLDPVLGTICSAVRAGRAPATSDLVRELRSRDPVWNQVCDVVAPKTYSDLTYMSYAIELLRAGLSSQADDGSLTLAIDNRHESRILERALQLAKAMRLPSVRTWLFGLYPLERALGAGRWSNLYFNDPGQHLLDGSGRLLSPSTLVDALYRCGHCQGLSGMYSVTPVEDAVLAC